MARFDGVGSGKGDKERPSFVSKKERDMRWEYAFRKTDLELNFEEWKKKHEKTSTN